MANSSNPRYWIMSGIGLDEYMRYYSFPDPNDRETWLRGARFSSMELEIPIEVEIMEDMEDLELSPFMDSPPVMSNDFHAALIQAGVSNLDVYDAILRSSDGEVEIEGFKAFNVIGMISATDMKNSEFAPDYASRLIDASFDKLVIDESKTQGQLMFRLAEFVSAIVVHDSVRRHIEAKKFGNIEFQDPSDFFS
jgi:hypothetical protein